MSHSGDIDVASVGTQRYLEWKILQYFSVNFHFLMNDKSDNRDFFTIDTIDDGLSFYDIEGFLLADVLWMILYTMSQRTYVHR